MKGAGRYLCGRYACDHARRGGAAALALLVSLLLGLSLFSTPGAHAAGESVSTWLTTGDRGKLLEQQSSFSFGGDTSGELVIDVNENHRYQQMDGFGAAMTDSSAYLIATKMSSSQRAELLSKLFSPTSGVGLNYLRVPAGASDFSLSHYTYDDTCCDLSDFSIAADETHRIPLLLQAKSVNPALRLIPGMWLTPSDEIALVNQLGPALTGKGVKIFTLDHNWALAHYGADVLRDAAARQYVDGTAFHCYGGAPDYQSIVREAHPDKEIHFTECSSGDWATNWGDNLVWDGVNLVVGATRNWAQTVLKWNLALDPSHGPHTGGCSGCTGLVTIDPGSGSVTYNHDYYALGSVGKFVAPGAQRIASTARAGDLHSVAFRNPDGSKVLVVVNAGGQGRGFLVRWGGQAFQYSLDKQSIATFRWNGTQGAPSAPAAPGAPSTAASDGKVTLKWAFSPLATGYDVRRSAAGGPWTTIATGVPLPEYVDRDVVNGTSYAYAVAAVNGVAVRPRRSRRRASTPSRGSGSSPAATPPAAARASATPRTATTSRGTRCTSATGRRASRCGSRAARTEARSSSGSGARPER